MWAVGVITYILLCGFPPFFSEDDDEVFDMILEGEYTYPAPQWSGISDQAKDLIDRLLVVDVTRRLGCGRGGVEEVMMHSWFHGIDWDALYLRQVPPPINPNITSEGDTHNFPRYSDPTTAMEREPSPTFEFGDLFSDF